jgi:hypothetical protein
MKKLDAITLDFARQVIEEETGTPLPAFAQGPAARPGEAGDEKIPDDCDQARLIARDDKNNPLISTFDWTDDAAQRILRVPAGFMRNKTQERIEELARERSAAAIDLAMVEEGIEIGKKMMAEMIATYSAPSAAPGAANASSAAPAASNGTGYLNEVTALNSRSASGEHH